MRTRSKKASKKNSPNTTKTARRSAPKPAKLSRLKRPADMSLEDWQVELRRQFGREQDYRLKNVGEQTVITLSASGDAPDEGCLFAFGESEQETAVYRIKNIAPSTDLVAQITLVDDAPAISTADQGTIPPYTPNITIPPAR